MVAAEKWYEYEDNYRKYGIDMRPTQVKSEGRRAKAKSKVKANANTKAGQLKVKDRTRFMAYVVVLAVVCIGVVISGAYAATLKCDINSIIAENEEITKDIETLNVQIKTANGISAIESKALGELGMVYPTANEIVFIGEPAKESANLGVLLKEQAYQ